MPVASLLLFIFRRGYQRSDFKENDQQETTQEEGCIKLTFAVLKNESGRKQSSYNAINEYNEKVFILSKIIYNAMTPFFSGEFHNLTSSQINSNFSKNLHSKNTKWQWIHKPSYFE